MAKSLKNINPVPADLELRSSDVPERISWSSVSDQIMSVMNIERGVFYTLIELLFRPGKAVRIHLFKNRKRLLNPIRFLALSTTLATLVTFHYFSISEFSETFYLDINSEQVEISPIDNDLIAITGNRLIDMLKQFTNLSYFFLAPAGAIAAWFFVRKKYTVPELAVANCYMWSMVNCVTLIFTPFRNFEGLEYLGYGVTLFFGIFYPLFFYTSFFNEGFKGFVKAFLVNGINLFLILLFFVIFAVFTFYDLEALLKPNASSF